MNDDEKIRIDPSARLTDKKLRLSKLALNFIFIPAIIFILFISFHSYRQVNNLIHDNYWVTHTHQVIQTIDAVLYDIIDLETHQRGYLITGDSEFLADTDSVKSHLKNTLDEAKNLTQDNSSQVERIQRLTNLIKQRINVLTQVMQLKLNNKLNTPEGDNVFHTGQDISNRVRDLGQEIKAVELVLLNERNVAAINSAQTTNQVLSVGSVISILILMLAFVLANNELSIRMRSESHRKMIEMRLRSIIENANDMIAALDKNYQFIIFNEVYQKEFKRLFGKSIAVGMSLNDIFSDIPEAKNKILASWKSSLEGNEYTKNIELELDNEKIIYEVTSSLIKNDENEINGAVHIIRNITKRIQEQAELQESYEKLDIGMRALQEKNEQITLLVEMSDNMLACNSQTELSSVLSKYCERILKFARGYLYIMHPSKNYLEMASKWGEPNLQEITFPPDQCWAIRRGRIHHVSVSHKELICEHVKVLDQKNSAFLCVPLMAQNDIYGLLYVEIIHDGPELFSDSQRLLINAFSELTALALANVRLRENLRHQSIRDPLTGLYNRRYLEDFLFKQMHQAERTRSLLAVMMLDLDHFKKINDTYGHDAGDIALKELGKILQNDIRVGDLAARYGGEEFIIIFYNTDAETARIRATNIKDAVSLLQVKYGAQQVGHITISIGISEYPKNGLTPAELIEAADKALYFAKNNGRNKIILFSEIN